jgi:uncharacterized coiled-coil DUF342 family protein
VKNSFDAHKDRIDQIEQTFVDIINEVESINVQYISVMNQMAEIQQRQQEVLIGKRNINCLSCAADP